MSSLIIKLFALITMTIDHTGYILLNNNYICRLIGRTAFILYSFLLVEGFNHVKLNNKRLIKYIISIFVLAILSEIIFDLSINNKLIDIHSQNILFSLFTYLILMTIYEKLGKSFNNKVLIFTIIFAMSLISLPLGLNYGFMGFIITFSFYFISKINTTKTNKNLLYILAITIYTLLNLLLYKIPFDSGALLAIIPILLYNGNKGYNSKIIKYSFYLYYPIHLLILYLIKII